jgi:hypothetical protein
MQNNIHDYNDNTIVLHNRFFTIHNTGDSLRKKGLTIPSLLMHMSFSAKTIMQHIPIQLAINLKKKHTISHTICHLLKENIKIETLSMYCVTSSYKPIEHG